MVYEKMHLTSGYSFPFEAIPILLILNVKCNYVKNLHLMS
jgi:hypothetical protein